MLTLHAVAAAPAKATSIIALPAGDEATLRPLVAQDQEAVRRFFERLSPATRAQYDVVGASAHAVEMCAGDPQVDELRLVLVAARSSAVLGLVELSFELPFHDVLRYDAHEKPLSVGTDVRYSICLADALQGAGVGEAIWSQVTQLLALLACRRVLLWGGVYETNWRARRHYQRMGFGEVGRFSGADGRHRVDMIVDL